MVQQLQYKKLQCYTERLDRCDVKEQQLRYTNWKK